MNVAMANSIKAEMKNLSRSQLSRLIKQLKQRLERLDAKPSTARVIYLKVKENPQITQAQLESEMVNHVNPMTGRKPAKGTLQAYRCVIRSALRKKKK